MEHASMQETQETTSRDSSGLTRAVFHDREALARGVKALASRSVPADSIQVFVLDEEGRRSREVNVADEAGALHGALMGAAIGAGVGVVIVVLGLTGVLGGPGGEFFAFSDVIGTGWAVLATAAAGAPFGALLGMGNWRGHKRIPRRELRRGAAEVVVDSEELAVEAAEALREAGATEVTRG